MFIIFCLTSYMFFTIQKKKGLKGRKADERRIKPREGCEGQDEVKKDTGGKLVKGIYTLLLSRLKDRQGGRLTSVQPIQSRRNKARWLKPDRMQSKVKMGNLRVKFLDS